MREILVVLNKAKLKPNFKPQEMPSLGRIDVGARAVIYGLWKSYGLRTNTKVWLYFSNHNIAMIFDGSKIKKLSPNEYEVGNFISKAYTLYERNNKEISYNGVSVISLSFEDVVRKIRNRVSVMFLMDVNGDYIEDIRIRPKDVGIILGDNEGLKEEQIATINKIVGKKLLLVSLGDEEYLTSQCITIMHWWLDQRGVG